MSKHDVCHKLLDGWEILWFLLSEKNISIIRGNKLPALLPLMEEIEAKVKLEMDRAGKLYQDCKPYKIPNEMSDHEYLQLCSFKVD